MPKNLIPFHVQHIARPVRIERILGVASNDQPFNVESVRLCLAQ